MAKARRQRHQATYRPAGPGAMSSEAEGNAVGRGSTHRSRVIVALVLMGIVAAGVGAWRVLPLLGEDGPADGAANLQPIATLDAPDVHSLLIDRGDPDHVWFGSHAGIQESRDGGFTWAEGTLRNADAMSLASRPEKPATLYAAGHDVFQVSRDGGASWQPLDHDLPGTDVHALAQDQADARRLFAYVAGQAIFTSTDGGTTWSRLPAQPSGAGMHITLAAGNASLYAATDSGILLSRDQGGTWQLLAALPDGGMVTSLAIAATAPEVVYAGTRSGLAKSADGGAKWVTLDSRDIAVLALATAPTDPNRVLVAGDDGAIYRSDDGGATWRSP